MRGETESKRTPPVVLVGSGVLPGLHSSGRALGGGGVRPRPDSGLWETPKASHRTAGAGLTAVTKPARGTHLAVDRAHSAGSGPFSQSRCKCVPI